MLTKQRPEDKCELHAPLFFIPSTSQVARRDVSLTIANKRYKRLEADMIRSRIELMDTLSIAEKDRQEHSRELSDVQGRAKGLEVALRTADEVHRWNFHHVVPVLYSIYLCSLW